MNRLFVCSIIRYMKNDIVESVNLTKDVLEVYAAKFKQFSVNVKARKLVAKELSVDEQNALKWQTVGDIFSFIDSSSLAKEHPKEAVRVLKTIAGIITVAFPPSSVVTGIIILLPQKQAAEMMEWLGKPTPEHIVHKIAEKKGNKKEMKKGS